MGTYVQKKRKRNRNKPLKNILQTGQICKELIKLMIWLHSLIYVRVDKVINYATCQTKMNMKSMCKLMVCDMYFTVTALAWKRISLGYLLLLFLRLRWFSFHPQRFVNLSQEVRDARSCPLFKLAHFVIFLYNYFSHKRIIFWNKIRLLTDTMKCFRFHIKPKLKVFTIFFGLFFRMWKYILK